MSGGQMAQLFAGVALTGRERISDGNPRRRTRDDQQPHPSTVAIQLLECVPTILVGPPQNGAAST